MRFRFPGLAPDTASPDQVRAFREARGWTVEQMADAVHASPLEVSAWEAGAVRVPPEHGFLAGAAASMPAIVFWRLLDSSVQLGDPRLWLGAAAAGGALGLWSSWRKEPAEASAAATAPTRPRQSPGAPHLLPGTRVPGAGEAPPPRGEPVSRRVRPR